MSKKKSKKTKEAKKLKQELVSAIEGVAVLSVEPTSVSEPGNAKTLDEDAGRQDEAKEFDKEMEKLNTNWSRCRNGSRPAAPKSACCSKAAILPAREA
jgi:hypothetical protein